MFTAYRQFGIELECFNAPVQYTTSGNNITAAIRAMGYPAKFQQYHHFATEYDKWQIKPDSSLRECPNALEVVSRTLPGTTASLAEVRKVAEWLDGNGYTVNHKCGYHIHLDSADMSSYEAAAVALRYNHCRRAIDEIMPPSRRIGGLSEQWARPLAGGALSKVRDVIAAGNRRQRWDESERYTAVNLQHAAKVLADRRIEFRQHSGTVDADKVIGWYKFLCEFVAETLKLVRENGGSVSGAPVLDTPSSAQPIVRTQRTRRVSRTRSIVTGTTTQVPIIDPGTDYDLFLTAIENNGVVTQMDAGLFGWPETRLRVTAHWLRRHGAELLTTQRHGQLAYVGINGARRRGDIFSAPAQIRTRVQMTAPVAAPVTASVTQANTVLLDKLATTPVLSGVGDEVKVWFETRRAAIAAADARRANARRP